METIYQLFSNAVASDADRHEVIQQSVMDSMSTDVIGHLSIEVAA